MDDRADALARGGSAERATVLDVMVRQPKMLALDATVAEARAALEDDHVHMLLLTEHGLLLGTLVRGDLPREARPTDRAQTFAVLQGRTVDGDIGADEARQLLLDRGHRRLAVVGADGTLLGLSLIHI